MSSPKKTSVSPPHAFDVHLATEYGIKEAIIIHHFQYWIEINQRLKRNRHEGRTWSYQTLDEIAAHFPYLSKSSVFDIIEKLCRGKGRKSQKDELDFEPVLMKGNFNKTAYDQTIWYAFINEEMFTKLGSANIVEGKSQNYDCEIPIPIPDTKPDTRNNKPSASKESVVCFSHLIEFASLPITPYQKETLHNRHSDYSDEDFESAALAYKQYVISAIPHEPMAIITTLLRNKAKPNVPVAKKEAAIEESSDKLRDDCENLARQHQLPRMNFNPTYECIELYDDETRKRTLLSYSDPAARALIKVFAAKLLLRLIKITG
jgi:hypothetical protein